jgi:hypothetical protein
MLVLLTVQWCQLLYNHSVSTTVQFPKSENPRHSLPTSLLTTDAIWQLSYRGVLTLTDVISMPTEQLTKPKAVSVHSLKQSFILFCKKLQWMTGETNNPYDDKWKSLYYRCLHRWLCHAATIESNKKRVFLLQLNQDAHQHTETWHHLTKSGQCKHAFCTLVTSKCLPTDQVKTLVSLFSFGCAA